MKEEKPREWRRAGAALDGVGVAQFSLPGKDVAPGIFAVQMKTAFQIPAQKGAKSTVFPIWDNRAKSAGIEATMGFGEDKPRVSLKQATPSTDQKRAQWLQKVRWSDGKKEANWEKAGGDVKAFPKVNKQTCDLDHILELQLGGNNVPENMQALDAGQNRSSGSTLNQFLKKTASEIQTAISTDEEFKDQSAGLPKPKAVIIHYDTADMPGESCVAKSCCTVEQKAQTIADYDVGKSSSGKRLYPVSSRGSKAGLVLENENADALDISKSSIPENVSGRTLISGLILEKWDRKGKGGGTVAAAFDICSRLPETLKKVQQPCDTGTEKPAVTFDRGEEAAGGPLTVRGKAQNIAFHLGLMSDVVINHLQVEQDNTLSGSGTITPSIKRLPKFDVHFDKTKFEATKAIPKEQLKRFLPIPGVTVTSGQLGLQIAPEFKPEGHLEFEVGSAKKKLLTGTLDMSANEQGLYAKGQVFLSLPGVDKAEGSLTFENNQWSGEANIETSQLRSKFKYIKGGAVKVRFSDAGMTAEGTVDLELPHTKDLTAKLLYDSPNRRWLFKGGGKLEIPRLKETDLHIEYDGDHLNGWAKTSFEFHKLTGSVVIVYRDGNYTGTGKIEIQKGKANGSIEVSMKRGPDGPLFSGKGSITYQITPDLTATGGIEIDEQQKVHLSGALSLEKPITLFKPITGEYKFFEVGVDIPIPGLSIPGVGVEARIEGSLSAGYQLGPAELRNTKIAATFDPLEDKPDIDLTLTSTLWIGASGHITGTVSGAIKLDITVASLEAGLKITATGQLAGYASADASVHYTQSRLEAEANFKIMADLSLIVALIAYVRAKAGIGWFSVEREKDWTLASHQFGRGLKLGMRLKKPFKYASDQALQVPSFDDIEWITPTIDPGNLLDETVGSAHPEEKEL